MKNLLKLGKTLSKVEQKQVFGGNGPNRLTKADEGGGGSGGGSGHGGPCICCPGNNTAGCDADIIAGCHDPLCQS